MATSGTTDFNLDLIEIAEEAWERASGGSTELRSGYNLRTARRSLNLLLLEWANKGLNLWTLDEGSIPLVEGVDSYTLPADTVDLMEHSIEAHPYGLSSSSNTYSVPRVSVSNYAHISNRNVRGRPTQVTVDRQVAAPVVRVWPIPDNNEYTLNYWRIRRMQDAGSGIQTQDVPFRLLPALVAGLAYMIAGKIPEGAQRLPILKAQYDEAWQLASEEDREKAPLRLVPRTSRW